MLIAIQVSFLQSRKKKKRTQIHSESEFGCVCCDFFWSAEDFMMGNFCQHFVVCAPHDKANVSKLDSDVEVLVSQGET